jgi:hypothetical protein
MMTIEVFNIFDDVIVNVGLRFFVKKKPVNDQSDLLVELVFVFVFDDDDDDDGDGDVLYAFT